MSVVIQKKQYLVYLAQSHANFRKAELESLAELQGISKLIDLSNYTDEHPFLLVDMEYSVDEDHDAKKLDALMKSWVSRGILIRGVYEVWGYGKTMEELHNDISNRDQFNELKSRYEDTSFKFEFVSYQGGKKSRDNIIKIIESFKYLDFKGPIKMKNPDEIFYVFENYKTEPITYKPLENPEFVIFGRLVGLSDRSRGVVDKFEISSRPYYGTTTFDSELSLVSCNLGLCSKDQIMYDPFVGTGSFMLAAAHFGSLTFGSDIDIRTLRGKVDNNKKKNTKGYKDISSNFNYYSMNMLYGDLICMDFTHSCIRDDFKLDSIISDPPYGVREGLKTCGSNKPMNEDLIIDGMKAYLRKDYIQPKKSYELDLLLDDLLVFASEKLKIGGRICFWMPCANYDTDNNELKEEYIIPQHPNLELKYSLIQTFNKWSRRLLVYVNRGEGFNGDSVTKESRSANNFRDRYFKGFS